jgi:hypothetical protein
MIIIWYILALWLALCGLIVIACLYIAMWIVAILAAVVMIGLRAARGQRGDQLWRKPFTPRLKLKIPAVAAPARYSDRR